MKVKLLISRAGVNFSQSCGDEITVDNAEGLRMIQANQAVLIEEVETAIKKAPTEKATKKKGKK